LPAATPRPSRREHGTPLFVYDRRRFAEKRRALIAALDRAGIRHGVRFALKANPDPGIARARSGPLAASTPARRARSFARIDLRLDAPTDQLHRTEPVGPRPRRDPGPRRST
jgi:hypothetical protein